MLEMRPPPGGQPLPPRQERLPAVAPSNNRQLVLWAPPRRGIGHRMLLVGSLLLILLLAGLATLALGEISLPSATVTITPQFTPVQQTLPIATKALQLSSSKTGTLPARASGHFQQSAQRAVGSLRFFNLAPFPQTILAGTTIVGRDEVGVITDSTATVLAGDAPKEAHVDIPAHAINSGPAGNIPAHDIYLLPCCSNITLNGVVVSNDSAFGGGQAAENYMFVSQQDVDTVASSLEHALLPEVQSALQKQILPSYQPYSARQCSATTQSNPPVGHPAERGAVSVTETCRMLVYNQHLVLQTAVDQFTTSTIKRPVAGYRLLPPKPHIITLALRDQNSRMLTCTVLVVDQWVFEFNQVQLAHLKQQLTGLSSGQAQTFLEKEPGVLQATIHLSSGNTFPSDINRINLILAVPAP